jgi:hypothetical protein
LRQLIQKPCVDASLLSSKIIDELLDVIATFQKSLPAHVQPYSHYNSLKLFTQVQLLTLLAIKTYTNQTYRGLWDFLKSCHAVKSRICPGHLPHYSPLKRFSDRVGVDEITDPLIRSLLADAESNRRSTLPRQKSGRDSAYLKSSR